MDILSFHEQLKEVLGEQLHLPLLWSKYCPMSSLKFILPTVSIRYTAENACSTPLGVWHAEMKLRMSFRDDRWTPLTDPRYGDSLWSW